MKKHIYLPLIAYFVCLSMDVLANGPPPPPPDPGSGSGGGPVGAPIDGGLGILLVMGAAYGGKKIYSARKEKKKAEKLLQIN
ncbi:MAG: hypothetical protein M0Q38_09490 [Bacteroidales bacterium]|jgi:hypothetical protein|nr:hypothetical protein [Bacteroidales bacterium]